MTRNRRFRPAAWLAIACLLAVSLGAALHHHEGTTGVDCVVCHAAAAPALEALPGAAIGAPQVEPTPVAPAPSIPADRLTETFSPARAPPAAFSFEA